MDFQSGSKCCGIIRRINMGFVNYEPVPAAKPDTFATEAIVFLLVGARSNWKYPVGHFLVDKMSSQTQVELVRIALKLAAEAGLKVWSVQQIGLK